MFNSSELLLLNLEEFVNLSKIFDKRIMNHNI